ncbi:MAG: very short patch repair endonuclease [Chthoniobacterales bacterium]
MAKRQAKKSLSSERFSYAMSRVRSSRSAIEVALGRALWAAGFRYRKQYPIFGRPDFVLVSDRIAIFCDSEFWHGYRWGERRKAHHKTNQTYWFAKIERNRARDRAVNRRLRREGWTVIRFWEDEIKQAVELCVGRITAIRSVQKTRALIDNPRSGSGLR